MSAEAQHQLDLTLLGQQARGHIKAAQKHDMQGANHWLSAGLCLIDAKKAVGHGGWGRWLAEHRISQTTANRAMRVAASDDPHKEAATMQAADAEDKRQRRAATKSTGHPTDLTVKSASPKVTQPSFLLVRDLIKCATEAELLAVKDLLLKLRAIALETT